MDEKKGLKKQILAFVVAVAMAVTLMPGMDARADGEVIIGNFKYQLNPTNRTATLTDCNFPYNDETVTEINISTVEYERVTYTVTAVGEYAVSDPDETNYYGNITSVSLPNVTTIGDNAFQYCWQLTTLNLPKVESVGKLSFNNCYHLTSVSLPEVKTIGEKGFFQCYDLGSVYLPKVVTIGNSAFSECRNNLTTINLPEATSIGEDAFANCSCLAYVSLPKVTSLNIRAFSYCNSLETISMPEVIEIGDEALVACAFTEISFPKLKNLGAYALGDCMSVASVSLPSLYQIQEDSLMNIEAESLTIPDIWEETDPPIWDSDEEKFLWKEGRFNTVNYVHTHNWTFTADEAVLTATCSKNASHTASLTLSAPATTTYSGSPVTATIEDTSSWTAAGLSVPAIQYYNGDVKLDSAPIEVGTYEARITAGSATAKAAFEIKSAAPPYNPNPPYNPPYAPVTPTTPATPTGTIGGDTGNTTNVSVNVSGNSAVVSNISKDTVEQIASSVTNGTDIVIDVSGTGTNGQQVSAVTLTKATAERIADALESSENNKENLVIKTEVATVSIDATALKSIADQAQGNEIQLVVENITASNLNETQASALNSLNKDSEIEIEQTFEAYFVSGGKRISNFNGGLITVGKINFTAPEGKDSKYYHIYYVSEDGKLQPYDTWYANGILYFETNHFSDYVIVYDKTRVNGRKADFKPVYLLTNPENNDQLFTTSKTERKAANNAGWTYEGKIFTVNKKGREVYRLFNPLSGEHLYTISRIEKQACLAAGWIDEGVAFMSEGNVDVYRLTSPDGWHYFTADYEECESLVEKGYTFEGTAFKVN